MSKNQFLFQKSACAQSGLSSQDRFPVEPRHTLVSYFSEARHYGRCHWPVQAPKSHISLITLFLGTLYLIYNNKKYF